MLWQDWVFGVGGFLFAPSPLPMVVRSPKPPLLTSGLTALILWSFVIAFATLGLWLSACSGVLTAGTWTVLAMQRCQVYWRARKEKLP